LRRLVFKRIAAFLAVGEANRDYLRASGVPPERVFVARHFVENERFLRDERTAAAGRELRDELGIARDALVFLFAGKLEPNKRPLDLMRAWRAVRERLELGNPTAALLFVGSGVLERELRAEAAGLEGKTVFFSPFRNQSEMPRVYAAADVLVLPSQSETWGLCVNEAMNAATPAIVSSHVGCAPDLIRPGETGWIFPAGDVDALGRLLIDVADRRAQLPAIALAAQRHVAGFSRENATRALLGALAAIAAR
jgi:glycosyltransferase involved in cell wall biosynthesis